jgi:hypothetical protein
MELIDNCLQSNEEKADVAWRLNYTLRYHGKIDPILGIHDLRLPENGDSNAILDVISFCYIIFAMLFMH